MLTTIDHIVSLLSSTAIGTAVVLLACLRIPHKTRWAQMSQARWILVASFSVLMISGFFKIDAKDSYLLSTITLCVASYQALLFSYTASVMLTRSISSHNIIWALVLITLFTCLLFVSKLAMPELHTYVWYLAASAYCAQLIIHTVVFRKRIGETAIELENYYDENVDYHLSPIKKLFFSALFIGILAALAAMLPFYRWGYNTFVLIYTIYYIYVAMAVINYCFDGDFFLVPAEGIAAGDSKDSSHSTASDASIEEETPDTSNPTFEALEKELNAWVTRKEFTKVDVSTDEVAAQLRVTRQQFAAYFTIVHNTTFRSWRQQLRLEYARTLINENPNLPLAHLHEQVGFNDRSNFHSAFRKFTGITPQEYKDSLL